MNAKSTNWGLAVLALGVVAGCWLLGSHLVASRTADRFVTVKGLAERDVTADMALWPLQFVSTNDNLDLALQESEQSRGIILGFLAERGIVGAQVEIQSLEVTDVLANPYRSGPATSRFIIRQSLLVRSDDPGQIKSASQEVGELVGAGVVLTSDMGPAGTPTYLFTRLNDLKPEMIAEATASARQSAQQFALDSGSRLGEIRRANQGVFVILPGDPAPGVTESSQINKKVRVVATIEYFLDD